MCSEASAQAEWEAVLFLGIFSSLSSFQLTSFLSSRPSLSFGHLRTDLRPGKGRTHWGLTVRQAAWTTPPSLINSHSPKRRMLLAPFDR